jgi:transposase InsO family protein
VGRATGGHFCPLVSTKVSTRQREGRDDFTALVAHTDHGSQYLAIRHGERIATAGMTPSVGVVGSSYDNARAETINDLDKTEVIRHLGRRPDRGGCPRRGPAEPGMAQMRPCLALVPSWGAYPRFRHNDLLDHRCTGCIGLGNLAVPCARG